MEKYYKHSAYVQEILKDAQFAAKLSDDNYESNGHGMAYSGNKAFYRGAAGEFIVHTRFYRGYEPPLDRVLSLPITVQSEDYLSYESEHQADYSSWQDMILDEPRSAFSEESLQRISEKLASVEQTQQGGYPE